MLSAVICDNGTPFSEAVWREFQTRTKHGISESIQNDFGASSKSSGSKSKEPKVALVSYEEDDFVEKKLVPKAISPAAKKAVAAKKKRKKKAAKKPKKVTPGAKKADPSKKDESDHSNYMSSDGDLYPDEFPSKKPSVRPRGTIHTLAYTPGDLCYVCNGEHLAYYCPCRFSIPPNTHINDNYYRCCSKCGGVVDEFDFEEGRGFKCKRCSRRVRAYARRHSLPVSWKLRK